ncbi:MAG: OsmC family protein [Prevotellaceae bacterium]|jgi:hypothetical protein|nr:OsmC family protein [Prevotellaceae bacterium]
MSITLVKPEVYIYNSADHVEFHKTSYKIGVKFGTVINAPELLTGYNDKVVQENNKIISIMKLSFKVGRGKQRFSGGILRIAGLLLLLVAFVSCKTQSKSDVEAVKLPSTDYPAVFTTPAAAEKFKAAYPPLNDFLKRRLAALQLLEQTPSEELQPVTLSVRTTAEQRSGVRRIRIRGHQIISDSDYSFAGYSLGPGSPESTLTVIASDIADTYLSQAALKGVRIDSLGVSIASRPDSVRPAQRVVHPHNLLYTIYVNSPATDEELEELRLLTEKHSPVFNLASTKQTLIGNIEYRQTPKDLTAKPPYQPGLREYLKYKRAALLARRDRGNFVDTAIQHIARRNAERPQVDRLHVEVDPVSGARRVHIRHFNFIHDNPVYLAGNDLGPTANEHFLAVLTSCITHITEIQAASHEVVLDSLAVSAKGTLDIRSGRPGYENVPNYLHNIQYTVHASSPHTYDDIVVLRDAVEAVCPIYNLYLSEQKIEGRIVRNNPDSYRIHPQYHNHYKD